MTTADKITLVGVVTATLLGVLSLLFALRANRISVAAEELARRAYLAERRIALRSEVAKDPGGGEYLAITPAGADQAINSVTLCFPTKVRVPPIALVAGDLRLPLAAVTEQLREYWDSRTPPEPGYALVRPNVPIPVAAVVHGYTKGDAVVTKGVYDLYVRYIRYDGKPSDLSVLSLTLNNWSFADADPQAEADWVLGRQESLAAPSNVPLKPSRQPGG